MSDHRAMTDARVTPTNIPGLVDVALSDGREFRDLTVGQFNSLWLREHWRLCRPDGTPYEISFVSQGGRIGL